MANSSGLESAKVTTSDTLAKTLSVPRCCARSSISPARSFLLAALVAALVMFLGAGTASAATATAAQTRVGAHASEAQFVEPHGSIAAGRRVGGSHSTYDSALATGADAEDLVAAASRPARECSSHDGGAPSYDASVLFIDARTVVRVEAVGRQATAVPLRRQVGVASEWSVSVSGFGVAAEAEAGAAGVVYRRIDQLGGKPYVGQSKSIERFLTRQAEHARANPDAVFRYEELGRAAPGTQLDRLEEFFIRQEGGPTNLSNPNGLLANPRHQMSNTRYWEAGGDY